MSRAFLIGEVSASTGINMETIRYYERIGLVPKPPRSAGGRRNYDGTDLQRLAFVRRCRDIGFSIDDIRSLLTLAAPGHRSCSSVQIIAENHCKSIETRIADLVRLHALLSVTIKQCSGKKVPQCAVLDMLALS